jgi:acyl-CoA thioester hydrolase
MSFDFPVRVYYEDTDAGGIVYYANYLKFMERARTEALLGLGLSQTVLRDESGVLFAVRAVAIDYLAPARLEDQLVVTCRVERVGGARIEMTQDVLRGETLLATARVTLVCVGLDGRATRVPDAVRALLCRLTLPRARI